MGSKIRFYTATKALLLDDIRICFVRRCSNYFAGVQCKVRMNENGPYRYIHRPYSIVLCKIGATSHGLPSQYFYDNNDIVVVVV